LALPLSGRALTGHAKVEQWVYYHYEVPTSMTPDRLILQINRTGTIGDPDIYVNLPSVPHIACF
jgi:hypothetical protein